jgi:hypothetical protein
VHTAIVELRQYTLRPGRRDELIDLFDSKLVESQEAVGMCVIGQFRDLDRPDRFVWLRGFPSMEERLASLEAFYTGPVWKTHSAAANATMLETDDVLLLRPATPGSAFRLDGSTRGGDGFVTATISPAEDDGAVRSDMLLGCFVTEPSENTFPALPVREGENLVVRFSGYPDRAALEASPRPARGDLLRLAPTSRSLLNGHTHACDETKGEP